MLFPSEEWLEEYRQKLNNDDRYAEQASGWGVDFNGDFVFIVEDMPVDEIDRDNLPSEIEELLDEYVDGDEGYAYIGLKDGKCTEVKLLGDPNDEKHGFKLKSSYENWKALIDGEIQPMEGMMSGKLELEGDMQTVMQYTQGAERLAEVAAEISTEYIDDEYT